MHKRAQKYYRLFPLYQQANGCGRLFVSIMPAVGEELRLQLHIDQRLQTVQGETTLVITDWLQSLNAVTIVSTEKLLVAQVSASQESMTQIVKELSEQFDLQLVHAFQINFFAYLAARPFLGEDYWKDKASIVFEDAEPGLRQRVKELNEQDARERSDSPDSYTIVGELCRLRAKGNTDDNLEPWCRKVDTPSPVDDSVFIWNQPL